MNNPIEAAEFLGLRVVTTERDAVSSESDPRWRFTASGRLVIEAKLSGGRHGWVSKSLFEPDEVLDRLPGDAVAIVEPNNPFEEFRWAEGFDMWYIDTDADPLDESDKRARATSRPEVFLRWDSGRELWHCSFDGDDAVFGTLVAATRGGLRFAVIGKKR